ncbi:MAG: class I adenylate-forming enzyme family protein [Acidobacteriota bacterium]
MTINPERNPRLPEHYDQVPMDWVGDWIGRRTLYTPDREAVYDAGSNRRFTYRQLNRRANQVGAFFIDHLGLDQGDVVCLLSHNRVEALDIYFAAGKTGIILAPLSYRLVAAELSELLDILQPRALFYGTNLKSSLMHVNFPRSLQTRIAIDELPEGVYATEILSSSPKEVNRPLAMNQPYLYVHTGGSTGRPKVCVVTHRQMIWNSFNLLATASGALGWEGRELVTFPFYHIGGWNTVTPIVHIGGSLVLMRRFDADRALGLIQEEGVTHFGAVESVLRFLMQSPRFAAADLKSMKYINSAGAPCAPDVMRAFWNKGVPLTQSYGLTEAGPSNFMVVPHGFSPQDLERQAGTIGHPMFHCEAHLLDCSGAVLEQPGEVGELCFRNPNCFEGYLKDNLGGRQVVDSRGWVHSGDLAKLEKDGSIRIVGRVDNVFVSGGENVSPEEVERVLERHPAVARACVVDVPDRRWGRVGWAAIVPREEAKPTVEELKTICRTSLARFKVPKHVEIVDRLPLTGAGKVDRRSLHVWILQKHAGGEP